MAASVLENLSDEEAYLWAILQDYSGLDLAEFTWHDPEADAECWRAWPYQWKWFRNNHHHQIDQCLAEGTLVLTRNGQVPIEDVVIGDEVLTHRGRWRPVTYTWDRGVRPVVAVKGHGHPGLVATVDHKFWIDGTWKIPQPGDRWVTPFLFPEDSVPPIPERTYAPGRPCNVPTDVTDPAFLWLFGLFVAEGSCSSSFGEGGTVNRVTFSIHEDEVEEVQDRLRKVGLRFSAHRVADERCFNIVINSRPVAAWMSEHGGRGARNKHLQPWVFGLNDPQRMAILAGMVYGDGYTRPTGRVEYTTVSKRLAVDTKLLASSLGYFVTITKAEGGVSTIAGRTVQGGERFNVGWHMNGRHNSVKSVIPYGMARVYDLEVAEDHSFVAESIVVSNCGRSVGKSLSIKVRGFAFPFLFPGQEMVVTAPELVHLEPIVSLIEGTFFDVRLGRETMLKGRSSVTHRPFQMNFINGARIIGRIPQKDGRGVKGVHPIWLELDEAQDYPEQGWTELVETLKRGFDGAVWRAHGVTRGVRDKFFEFTQDTPDNKWKVHRYVAMHRPNWTDEEREEKISQYGSRDHPDYRRNVLGLHGDATNPLFVLHQLMKCVDDDETSDYNQEEYFKTRITGEMLEDKYGSSDIEYYLNFPSRHQSDYQFFWVGEDVGYTNHPSEILVFGEYRPPKAKQSVLKLLSRVHLARVNHRDQVRAMLHIINFYRPKVFAMDRTGLGLPLFQDLQNRAGEIPALQSAVETIKGYNFSSKILVDFDSTVVVDPDFGDAVKDAGIERNVLEYATDRLRVLVDQQRLQLPWDRDLIGEFQGQTFTYTRGAMDQYGRKRFSQGKYHALDAARMAALGQAQFSIEEFTKKKAAPVILDAFIDGW